MDYGELADKETKSGLSRFSVPYDHFIALNNRLSERYKVEQNPTIRREIAAHLFELDFPLFRVWRVFGEENQEDYEQEAFILFQRALDAFAPARGAFVNYLQRFTVGKARRLAFGSVAKHLKIEAAAEAAPVEDQEDPPTDPIFWSKIKKAVTAEQWAVLEPRLFEGKTPEEIADRVGTSVDTARARLHDALSAVKVEMARGGGIKSAIQNVVDGSEWVPRRVFAQRLSLTLEYVKMLLCKTLNPRKCPLQIDSRDVLDVNGCRIRFLEKPNEGLIYPRFIRRKPILVG